LIRLKGRRLNDKGRLSGAPVATELTRIVDAERYGVQIPLSHREFKGKKSRPPPIEERAAYAYVAEDPL